jgi:hypothetical protein
MLNTVEAWPHLCAQYAPFIDEGVNSCLYAQLVTIFKDSFTNDVICIYLREYCSILSIWQCKACLIPHFHVWANLPVTSDQRMHVDYTLNRDVTLQGTYQCFSAIMVSNLSMKIVASGNVRIWN